jgi:hypothetical protein
MSPGVAVTSRIAAAHEVEKRNLVRLYGTICKSNGRTFRAFQRGLERASRRALPPTRGNGTANIFKRSPLT